ncbi:hypothetical protein BRLA_c022660 [Brevibacillus laterosporus LMG 15441]|uniref:RHS repeat-associated core domain protein n=1 Tax=Brevibacillus laterosporus LMG 15441 TaxID=1042163 RepID=A0A075R1X5_BRELA|nr:hypothetical protein BRLA_c022660 [Brevibacillus laterosporus LMG 15441]
MQVDNPLSLNRYTYVHNNPVSNVDLTGNWYESKDGKWAHPNTTKHMVDYLTKNPQVKELSPKSKQMIEQAMLTSFRTAVEKAVPNLKSGKNFMNIGQWEIGINVSETEVVIYHALFK